MSGLHTISYFSRNAMDGQDSAEMDREIRAILALSRRNNALKGITGALLYSAGCFAQVLEGPLDEVEAAFERIQTDPRHRDIKVLQYYPIERRSFGNWSMAFIGNDVHAFGRAITDDEHFDVEKIIADPEGLDVVSVLHNLLARHELHGI